MKKLLILIGFLLAIPMVNAQTWITDWTEDCGGGSNFPNSPWNISNSTGGDAGTYNGECYINDTTAGEIIQVLNTAPITHERVRVNWTWKEEVNNENSTIYFELYDALSGQAGHNAIRVYFYDFPIYGDGFMYISNGTDYLLGNTYQEDTQYECSMIYNATAYNVETVTCNGNTQTNIGFLNDITPSYIGLSTGKGVNGFTGWYDDISVEYWGTTTTTTSTTTTSTTTTSTTTTISGATYTPTDFNFDFENCIDAPYPTGTCGNWTSKSITGLLNNWGQGSVQSVDILNTGIDPTIAQGVYAIRTSSTLAPTNFVGNITSIPFRVNYDGNTNVTFRQVGVNAYLKLCEYSVGYERGCKLGMPNFICRKQVGEGNWATSTKECGNLYGKDIYISFEDNATNYDAGIDDIMFKDASGNNLTLLAQGAGSPPSTYQLSGYVKDEAGTGLDSVGVFLGDAFTYLLGTEETAATGYFEFNLSSSGLYSLSASKYGYGSECTELITVTGQTEQNITIYDYNLRFTVLDASNGDFLNNAFVYAIDTTDETNYEVCHTNSTGQCTILANEGTLYMYIASANGYVDMEAHTSFYPICRTDVIFAIENEEPDSIMVVRVYDGNNETVLDGVWVYAYNHETNALVTQNITVNDFTELHLTSGVTYRFEAVKPYYEKSIVVQYVGLPNDFLNIPLYHSFELLQDYNVFGQIFVGGVPTEGKAVQYYCSNIDCPDCTRLGNAVSNSTGNYSFNVKEDSSCLLTARIGNLTIYNQPINYIDSNYNWDIYLDNYKAYTFYAIDNLSKQDLFGVSMAVRINGTLRTNHLVQSFGDLILPIRDSANISIIAEHEGYNTLTKEYLTDYTVDATSGYAILVGLEPRDLNVLESEVVLRPYPSNVYNSTAEYIHDIQITVIDLDNRTNATTKTVSATNLEMLREEAGTTFYLLKGGFYEVEIQSGTYKLLSPPFHFTPRNSLEVFKVFLTNRESNEAAEVSNDIYTDFFNNYARILYLLGIIVIIMALLDNIVPKR